VAEKKDVDALRITNQFRSKTGFVYDLKCNGARLTINIAPRQNSGDAGEWSVEARLGSSPDAASIPAWGSTRVDALREVGRLWTSKAEELGLPTFDWDAVATMLSSVRALGKDL
jgi:hypothetical protein